MDETPFQETNALLAVMNGDGDQADAILRDMLPGELRDLATAAQELSQMAMAMRRIKLRVDAAAG